MGFVPVVFVFKGGRLIMGTAFGTMGEIRDDPPLQILKVILNSLVILKKF